MDAMSSEESCYEDDENGSPKVAKYCKKKLPWESRAMQKLDKAYQKSLSKRANERIIKRIEAEEPSERQYPREFPEWALADVQ